jgi:arylsulfatase A-like enzyme
MIFVLETKLMPHPILRFVCLLLAAFTLLPKPSGADPATPQHPNFLFVYLDDQRWDAFSFYQKLQNGKGRFPWLQTPNLDKLASQSVWFRNAFATDSLCSPSRASFLTGQYPHTHTVTNNHMPLPLNAVTYATLLHAAGYATGFVGKWHMGNMKERPGFDYAASFIGQGEYYNCAFFFNGGDRSEISPKWTDARSVDYALDFLGKHKDGPFVLAVAMKSVHSPRKPNEQDTHLYDGCVAGIVPNLKIAAPYRAAYSNAKGKGMGSTEDSGETFLNYFRCLTGADREIGRLLDGLDALGLSQNTIVIYSSDNGYDLGEHELGDKRAAYEESMRIPFMVRVPFLPNSAGRTVDQMVLNVDVAPTMLDYAGVPIPSTMQGRSIRPLLEQKNVSDWSRAFLYEYFFEKKYKWPTMVAVRTTNAKLVTYPNHPEWTELFKLDLDPYETQNLAGKSEDQPLQTELQSDLDNLKSTLSYNVPADSDQDTYVQDMEKATKGRRAPPRAPGAPETTPGTFNYDKVAPGSDNGG